MIVLPGTFTVLVVFFYVNLVYSVYGYLFSILPYYLINYGTAFKFSVNLVGYVIINYFTGISIFSSIILGSAVIHSVKTLGAAVSLTVITLGSFVIFSV